MVKVLATIGGAVALAGVVGLIFITASPDEPSLKKVSEAAQPFVAGVAVEAGDKIKERIKNTPDQELEKEAEVLAGKLYHITKGALKGQVKAMAKDATDSELAREMYNTGKKVADKVVKPLAQGAADSAVEAMGRLDKAAKEFRDFKTRNSDVIDSFTQGANEAYNKLPKAPPPLPPLPPPPFGVPPGLGPQHHAPFGSRP